MSRRENKERRYKVIYNKKSTGAVTPRITIPNTLLLDIGVKEGDYIYYTRVPQGIIIKRVDNDDN